MSMRSAIRTMKGPMPVLSAVVFAAAFIMYGCEPEDWGPVSYPNEGEFRLILANEADSCSGTHYAINIDRYGVGDFNNLLPPYSQRRQRKASAFSCLLVRLSRWKVHLSVSGHSSDHPGHDHLHRLRFLSSGLLRRPFEPAG